MLSLYLNLDPSGFPNPRARRSELDALLAQARKLYLDPGGLGGAEAAGLEADLRWAEDAVGNGGLAPEQGARALAVFVGSGAGIAEVHPLARAVEPSVAVAAVPDLGPLLQGASSDGWAAMLIGRRSARIMRGTADRLEPVAEVTDEVHRRHSQGGWSQARFQRGIDKEVHDHVAASCAELIRVHRSAPIAHLLLGGPVEIRSAVEAELPAELRDRVRGWIEVDVERAPPEEVTERSAQIVAEAERALECEALDRLGEALGSPGRAATGLAEVLAVLSQQRVQTLLVSAGLDTPGAVCPRCGALLAGRTRCPLDDEPADEVADVIAEAIAAAIRQDAEVHVLADQADLEPHGSIAAVVRY